MLEAVLQLVAVTLLNLTLIYLKASSCPFIYFCRLVPSPSPLPVGYQKFRLGYTRLKQTGTRLECCSAFTAGWLCVKIATFAEAVTAGSEGSTLKLWYFLRFFTREHCWTLFINNKMDVVHFLAVLCALCLASIDALMFHISPNGGRKCLKEEIHKDVLVTGDYEVSDAPGQHAYLRVCHCLEHGS